MLSILTELSKTFTIVRPCMMLIPLSGGQCMMACAKQTLELALLDAEQVNAVFALHRQQHLQPYIGHTHRHAMALLYFVCKLVEASASRGAQPGSIWQYRR